MRDRMKKLSAFLVLSALAFASPAAAYAAQYDGTASGRASSQRASELGWPIG